MANATVGGRRAVRRVGSKCGAWVRSWRETGTRVAKCQGGDRRTDRIEVHRSVFQKAFFDAALTR